MIDISFQGQLGRFAIDTAFQVPARGITTLFGPSGCGKTTILRAVAGLTRLSGHCRIGPDIWQSGNDFTPPHRRPVGYVFQDANLFPHLNVTGNLLFSRRGQKPGPGAHPGFDEVVALLGLEPLLNRRPFALSGGERQRVGIGRALLSSPRLLLMDEPLSALDHQNRAEILPFLERLRDQLKLPMLYVTHDRAEMQRLTESLVLMNAGTVVAAGTLGTLQADPRLPLAQGENAGVTLDGRVTHIEPEWGLAHIAVPGGTFCLTLPDAQPGQTRRMSVRADDVSLTLDPPSNSTILNILPARIHDIAPDGDHRVIVVLHLGTQGETLLARITRRSATELGLRSGMDVLAQVKGIALRG